jgi:hypothetical protein
VVVGTRRDIERMRRVVAVAATAVTLIAVLGTLAYALASSDDDSPTGGAGQRPTTTQDPGEATTTSAIESFDVTGDGVADVAMLGEAVVTLPQPDGGSDGWLLFWATLLAAVVGATASIGTAWLNRRTATDPVIEKRLDALEAALHDAAHTD